MPLLGLTASPDATAGEINAVLQAVKDIGAVPFLSLDLYQANHNKGRDGTLRWVNGARQVFGSARVYVEFDASLSMPIPDLDDWNELVPSIKAAAPSSYLFVYRGHDADPSEMAAMAAGAHPRPDALGWTETVCGSHGSSDDVCQRHPSTWSWNAEKINRAVKDRIGSTIPFFISNWNVGGDPERYQLPDSIRPLTTQGLDQVTGMLPQGLMGAMIAPAITLDDDGDHFGIGLVHQDGSLTAQGLLYCERDNRC